MTVSLKNFPAITAGRHIATNSANSRVQQLTGLCFNTHLTWPWPLKDVPAWPLFMANFGGQGCRGSLKSALLERDM